jgi:signal transduction histidine kinase
MNRLSIRWRIAFWNTAAFAVILLGFGLAIYGLLRKTHYDHVDRRLQAQFDQMPASDRGDAEPGGGLLNAGGYPAYVVDESGRVINHTAELSSADMVAAVAPVSDAPRFDTAYLPEAGHVRRLVARPPSDSRRTVIILAELAHVDEELWEVIRSLLITTPITLVAAASIAYFLACKALSPVDNLRQMTDEITAERLDRRLPIRNPADELGLLAQTINSMIARLEQSFSEIRRFAADASHELRTPVSVIRSEAELGLAAADCPDAARRRFESIVEECGRLAEMTTQLLVLCREEAGIAQMARLPVQFGSIVSESVEARRGLAEAKQQSLTVDIEGGVTVIGNAERLRQVVDNLLENAIKYTPHGGRVEVTLSRRNSEAVLCVQDNGIGIDAGDLPSIFDRFFQAEKGRPEAGGAGLGLSIVKSIVNAHQGRIEVHSEIGSGSVFRVFLPAVDVGPKSQSDIDVAASGSNVLQTR